jgi:hypothetical protein
MAVRIELVLGNGIALGVELVGIYFKTLRIRGDTENLTISSFL